jgi:carbon monoxide dehydrogenase subunit G
VQVEQTFKVPFPPALVWRCFHDTAGIVACLPGASLTEPAVDGMLKLAMTVKLGPIVAAFAGDAEMKLDDSTRSGSVAGGGSDRKSGSRVKGEAAFSLHDESGATPVTRVDVKVDFTIAGSLAQFSRGGIVQELATRMTDAFAKNLQKKLEAESAQAQADAVAAIPSAAIAADSASTLSDPVFDAPRPPAPSAASRSPAPPASPKQNSPLDLGQLFWPMLLARVRRLFGFGKKE